MLKFSVQTLGISKPLHTVSQPCRGATCCDGGPGSEADTSHRLMQRASLPSAHSETGLLDNKKKHFLYPGTCQVPTTCFEGLEEMISSGNKWNLSICFSLDRLGYS